MSSYVPVPLDRVQPGNALPVDVWCPDGRLLLRRGQILQSEEHRDTLARHQACMTQADALAWQRSLERMLRTMRYEGANMAQIAQAPMPGEIVASDYHECQRVEGGWLDMQEILRGLLYHGQNATHLLERLEGIEQKVLTLLHKDSDEGLFILFQALHDLSLGYCATHALLVGMVGVLTAEKLALAPQTLLLRSALVMNIGMAILQDEMALQTRSLSAEQRRLIRSHPANSVEILQSLGVKDPHLLDIVLWHHAPEGSALQGDLMAGLRLLNLADILVAKMAPRKTRAAMSPLGAAKSMVLAPTETTATFRQAMVAALGFYPPGTYVQLANGETAVSISRGGRATTPHVASIANTDGMPLSKYTYHDTSHAPFAVRKPVSADLVNIHVNQDKISRMRQQQWIAS